MEITFTKGNWEQYFQYGYTWRFPETPKFRQEENCIVNTKDGVRQNGCDFTSIMLKELYEEGAKFTYTTSFESYGAPLFVITDRLKADEDGILRFGNYYEVVLWHKGINIWDIRRENGEIRIEWLLRNDFPVEPGRIYEITVELGKKRLKIWVDGHYFELFIPELPEKAYVGLTACEGINRFYSMKAEKGAVSRK